MAIAVAGLIATARWLMLAGLAGALGGLSGRGLARIFLQRYEATPPAPLPPPWALRSSLLGMGATAGLAVVIFASRAAGGGLLHSSAGGLITRGQGYLVLAEFAGFALAAAALRRRLPDWSVLPLVVVVVAESIRAHPNGIVPIAGAFLTLCHLTPALMWAGMLLYTLRAATAWREDPAAMRGLLRIYANAAVWLFAMVVVTGVVTALVLVPVGSLLSTGYGIVVIAKAVLVASVAVLAIGGRTWLGRAPQPGAGPSRATRLECCVLAGVLALTAVLTVLTPPARPARGVAAAAASAHPGTPSARASVHRR